MLGVVASVCTPLPTRTQQLPTLLAQQFWELLRPFVYSLTALPRCPHLNDHVPKKGAYDQVKTRLLQSEADAEELNQ